MSGSVAFILKGYPRLSESFIAQEIRALEERGLDIQIISLRHPTDDRQHPVHDEIKARVSYLPEYLYQEPRRVWRAWRALRHSENYRRVRALWFRDLYRDRTPNRIRRFGQALVLAHELPAEITKLHAHFLHTPASVTRYAAALTDRTWTVSAHAKDVWTTPEWEIREKLAECAWLTTCSAAAYEDLARFAPNDNAGGKVGLIYHGLDLSRFPPPTALPCTRDGKDPAAPLRLLSVGRAVEKKGYPGLLRALADLPSELAWQFQHIGGGADLKALMREAERLGIDGRITWRGALAQGEVLEAYRNADLFVLPSRISASGDRDGLPNVLMEAQSQALACIATRVSAIPELIIAGETGILVNPNAPEMLAQAIADLAVHPERRHALGAAGQRRVAEHFAHDIWIDKLAAKFGLGVAEPRRTAHA